MKFKKIFCSLIFCLLSINANAYDVHFYASGVVNVKNTGSTLLFTTKPANFAPLQIFMYCIAANSITVPATVSIGTNSPNYNNIVPATLMTAETTGLYYTFVPSNLMPLIPPSTQIFANVTIAATGTSQTISIGIQGPLS
jgi:hypothetical protein